MTEPLAHCIALKVKGLTLQRGQRRLVQGLDIELSPSGGLALRGANGSGKTTLLRALAGLHVPVSGSISWTGHDPDTDPPAISFLGHLDPIKAHEPIIQQLTYWADVAGRPRKDIASILTQVELSKQQNLIGGVLSAGQKRRLSLARLLIEKRPVWLLDEPAAPLDAAGRALLGNLLDAHRRAGGLVIAAIHDTLPGSACDVLQLDQQIEAVA